MFPLAKAAVTVMTSLVLLASSVSLSGCGLPEDAIYQSGYTISVSGDHKTLTVTEGVARFSLDYPLRYTIDPTGGFTKSGSYTYVHLTSPQENTPGARLLITVRVDRRVGGLAGLESALAGQREMHSDLLLLERSPTEVAGLPGEQILYSYAWPLDTQGHYPSTTLVREVFFRKGDVRWAIGLHYYVTTPELTEGYENDLRQVLTTLKIQD